VTIDERREHLLAEAAESERELKDALAGLRRAAQRMHPAEQIRRQPLPWMFTGLLFGVWLGSRRNGSGD
jgi:hypothetical protein